MTTARSFDAGVSRRETWVGVGAVLVGGAGLAVTLAGAVMRDLNVALGGSAACAAGLVMLI
ncbi:MAG TPA: hypothetical protein VGI83_03035, partial [Gemmatimonadales bacterium]